MEGIVKIIITLSLLVAIFFFYRWFNYTLAYEGMVKDTIREMVKEEALKR